MADESTTIPPSINVEEEIYVLRNKLDDLTVNFYIAVAVLSCVLFLVGVLSVVVYYWVYVLEKAVKKSEPEENDYKIRRPVLRDEPKNLNREPSYIDPSRSNTPNYPQSNDGKSFKNPLTNNSYQQPSSAVPFRQQLQQQLEQNNPHQRYSNQNGFNDMRRNPRQTEQQLHQNFYGMDNSNFQY